MSIFSGLKNLPVNVAATMLAARGVPLLAPRGIGSARLHIDYVTDAAEAQSRYVDETTLAIRTGAIGNGNNNIIAIEGASDATAALPATVTDTLPDGQFRRWYISRQPVPSGAWGALRVRGDDSVITLDMSTLPAGGDMAELPAELAQKIARETTTWRAPLQAFRFIDLAGKSRAELALAYMEQGYAMLPLLIRGDPKKKQKRLSVQTSRATADPALAPIWFQDCPDYVSDDLVPAVATGDINRLVAIDAHNAEKFNAFRAEHNLPETLVMQAGRFAALYSVPEGVVVPGTGDITPDVSLQGDGGYVIIRSYDTHAYDTGYNGADCTVVADSPVAEMPAEALEWLAGQVPSTGAGWALTSGVSLTSNDDEYTPVEMTPEEMAEQRAEEKAERIENTGIPPFKMAWLIPAGKTDSPLAMLVRNLCASCNIDAWLAFACIIAVASEIINANAMLVVNNPKPLAYPGTLWLGICAPSATGKSEAKTILSTQLTRIQMAFHEAFELAIEEYEEAFAEYEAEKKAAKKENRSCDIERPIKPVEQIYVLNDATPEVVMAAACDNPGGVTWDCDELAQTFGSFSRYNDGSQAIRKALLTAFMGGTIIVKRKTQRDTMRAEHGYIGIVGTIQPKLVKKLFRRDDADDGWLQRFLIVHGSIGNETADPENDVAIRQDLIQKIYGEIFRRVPIRRKINPDADIAKPDDPQYICMEPDARKMLNATIAKYRRRASAVFDVIDSDEYTLNKRFQDIMPRLLLIMHCLENPYGAVEADLVRRVTAIFEALEHHIAKTWAMVHGEEFKNDMHITTDFIETIKSLVQYTRKDIRLYLYAEDGTDLRPAVLAATGMPTVQQLTKKLEKLGLKYKQFPGKPKKRGGYIADKKAFLALVGGTEEK